MMFLELLCERIGQQLHDRSKNLESLVESIRADPAAVGMHALALQNIDCIAQSLSEIGRALGSADPETFCRHSSLEQIRLLAMPEFKRVTLNDKARQTDCVKSAALGQELIARGELDIESRS